MDVKDLQILRELDQQTRASYHQIAKRTLISKETVQYRIRKLQEEQILLGYWALPKIGNNIHAYKLFLKNKGLSKEEKESFETFISESAETSWFAKTTGSWTYIITFMSTQDWKISTILAKIFDQYGNKFCDSQLIKSIGAISLNEKYLYEKAIIKPIYDDFLQEPIKLTSTEEKIISILTKNAREKYTDIAKIVGISAEAVSYSFKQLMKKGAINALKPRINHRKLGLSYYHLMLSISKSSSMKNIEDYFIAQKNCVFLMRHVGKYQLHAEIAIETEHINNIVEEFLDSFSEAISEYELCKVEKEFKIKVNK